MLRIALLCVTLVLASASLEAKWKVFKASHGKNYSIEEEVLRRYIYQANLKNIADHNEKYAKGQVSYYMGENQFTDMTREEVVAVMNGMNVVKTPEYNNFKVDVTGLPAKVDWREQGYVTGVKNQGQCGSCWAFSTTGSLEGQHFKASKTLVSLSEKNLMDCSSPEGNQGCNGGLMDEAFEYVIQNHGIDTEESYPYEPVTGTCQYNPSYVGATISSMVDVHYGSESALQKAVAEIGPISVAIDASHSTFQKYKGGVYNETRCSSELLDHGVLVVGYGTEGGKDYWLVKNSWGTAWGDQGYIKMLRNAGNQCGIASKASYPVV